MVLKAIFSPLNHITRQLCFRQSFLASRKPRSGVGQRGRFPSAAPTSSLFSTTITPLKGIITLTPSAVEQLKRIGQDKILKIGTEKKGCSGNVYALKYIEPGEIKRFDEIIQVAPGIQVVVDAKAVMSLIGSQMDWRETLLEKGFMFQNPNITEECGCGLSFMTKSST